MRPRCCLRYFTFFGINIGTTLVLPGPPRRNPPYVPSLTRGAGAAEALRPGEADPPLRSPGRPSRSPVPVFLVAAQARHEPLALVEPHLHANLAVGRVGFGEAVINIRAQRLQRQLAVQIPLGPRDFRAVQPTRDTYLDAPRAEAQRRFHRLAHGAAERHALLELHGHRLGDQLRLELGLLDLLYVDEDLPARALLNLLLQLVDFRPLASDDDARARRVDVDFQVVCRAL